MKKIDEEFFSIIGQAENLYLSEIKERIINNITEKLFTEFKKNAEDLVKKEAERLILGHIDSWRTLYNMADNLRVTVEWKNK